MISSSGVFWEYYTSRSAFSSVIFYTKNQALTVLCEKYDAHAVRSGKYFAAIGK